MIGVGALAPVRSALGQIALPCCAGGLGSDLGGNRPGSSIGLQLTLQLAGVGVSRVTECSPVVVIQISPPG